MNGPLYRDAYSRSNTYSGSSIGRILDHAETANAATNKFRLKSGSRFNSRATKIDEIRERLNIKKPVIQPKNKEKTVHEEIKKKPAYLAENEVRFKAKLKSRMKIEILKLPQQEDEQIIERQIFKPR
ncbi:TPA: hypothetical protein NIU59_005021 [Klebsiella michiganensis]|nr:hypothetical protein [Klebsiella michiganensis]